MFAILVHPCAFHFFNHAPGFFISVSTLGHRPHHGHTMPGTWTTLTHVDRDGGEMHRPSGENLTAAEMFIQNSELPSGFPTHDGSMYGIYIYMLTWLGCIYILMVKMLPYIYIAYMDPMGYIFSFLSSDAMRIQNGSWKTTVGIHCHYFTHCHCPVDGGGGDQPPSNHERFLQSGAP